MKKILKFFNASLFLSAFGVSYVELACLAVVNASLIDLIKLGFGKAGGSVFEREIVEMIQDNVRPLAAVAAALIALMWIGAVLSVLLRGNLPYIFGILFALIQAAGLSGVYFGIDSKLEIFRTGLSFFGIGRRVKMYSYTLAMWLGIYGLIILFSIIGLVLKGKKRVQEYGPIMPEQFYSEKNPLKRQKMAGSAAEQDYLARIHRLEQAQRLQNTSAQRNQGASARPVRTDFQAASGTDLNSVPKAVQNPVPKAIQNSVQEGRRFTGAVAGLTGEYASKAFPLSEKQQVFFTQEEGKIRLLELEDETTVASVYFIEEYQEYCVVPYETKSFFLKSGQPLGKGRTYYLPRGTQIYIKTKENRFILA